MMGEVFITSSYISTETYFNLLISKQFFEIYVIKSKLSFKKLFLAI